MICARFLLVLLRDITSQISRPCFLCPLRVLQSKKRQYDQEVENLERQQKQTIERLEQEHTTRLRDEAKRIKAEQDKELSKYQNMLKNRKKEVCVGCSTFACLPVTSPAHISPSSQMG